MHTVVRMAGAFAALLIAFAATPAQAGECRVACTRAKQVCVDAAKQARLACKQDCAAAESGSACHDACRAEFATAKTTCKAAILECRDACFGGGGGGGNPACADDCGATARTCAQGVRETAATCGSTCQDAARAAAAACKSTGNPFRCLLDVARDFATCLRPCAEAAFTGGRTCVADLHTCLEGCQGSPSAAFVR